MRYLPTIIAALLISIGFVASATAATEDELLAVITSAKSSIAEKANACRELRTAGTEKSVPALAALLTNAQLSHPARYALEPMPYASAGEALRTAAGKATGLTKSGILDSFGARRDEKAVPLLATALKDKDQNVVAAAAVALGRIASADAWRALVDAGKDRQVQSLAVMEGITISSDMGRMRQLAKLPDSLQRMEPDPTKRAALARRIYGFDHVRSDLARVVPEQRKDAAARLANVPADVLANIANDLQSLPTDSQIAVLAAIRIRGEKSCIDSVLAAVESKNETVRVFAVRALGRLSDAKAIPVLLKLAGDKGPVGDAAREALEIGFGSRVDETIVGAMQSEKEAARKLPWIELLQSRHATVAVPALVKESLGDDAVIRGRAMEALAALAAPKDVPSMIPAALKAAAGPERDAAERAVVLVCRQTADAERAAPVLDALQKAVPADRAALMPLLGRVGGAAARRKIAESLSSADAAVYDSGVRALSNWPDASVAEDLLGLVRSAKQPDHRRLALHAFTRVVVLPGGESPAQKLQRLQEAMKLATVDDERSYVIQRAAAVRTVETLRFVLPYLDQPPLAQEACKTVSELGRHKELRNPNLKEFEPALKKVLTVSTDAGTLERTRRYLQGN